MAEIINGNKIAAEILENLRIRIQDLPFQPRLGVFLVGENSASLSYVRIKRKRAEQIGVLFELKKYPAEVRLDELQSGIVKFGQEPDVCGILVQLPLPDHLDREQVFEQILLDQDVDCLTSQNQQKLIEGGGKVYLPPAPAAVLEILEYYEVNLADANILLVGSGDLIGKPLAAMLLHQGISFSLANKYTEDLPALCARADVIITGVGKAGLIRGDMVKDGAVVIDAGTIGSDTGVVRGDVDLDSVGLKARLISPVPGGVGPVTVAMLLRNVVDSAFDKAAKKV